MKDLLKIIEGMTLIDTCNFPITKKERIRKAEICGYNTAIQDVQKAIKNYVDSLGKGESK